MSTPTPAQLEELVTAAGELNVKLNVLSEIQRMINSYKAQIDTAQEGIAAERANRDTAVAEVRAASVRFRDALQATDPA